MYHIQKHLTIMNKGERLDLIRLNQFQLYAGVFFQLYHVECEYMGIGVRSECLVFENKKQVVYTPPPPNKSDWKQFIVMWYWHYNMVTKFLTAAATSDFVVRGKIQV